MRTKQKLYLFPHYISIKGDLKGASMRDIVIANKNKYIYNGKLYDDISIKRVISKEIELYVMERRFTK